MYWMASCGGVRVCAWGWACVESALSVCVRKHERERERERESVCVCVCARVSGVMAINRRTLCLVVESVGQP